MSDEYTPCTATINTSLPTERAIAKQPILQNQGKEVKSVLAKLPSDVVQELLGDYKKLPAKLVALIKKALDERLELEEAIAQAEIDPSLADKGSRPGINEFQAGADDPWY